MKIASASLNLQSQHTATATREHSESLRSWSENRGERSRGFPGDASRVNISDAAKLAQSKQSDPGQAIDDARDAIEHDPKIRLIRRMIEAITGRPVKVYGDEARNGDSQQSTHAGPPSAAGTASPPANVAASAGVGVEFRYHEARAESETTQFQAQGTVTTADGRQINFNLALSMNRQYAEEINLSWRFGAAAEAPTNRQDPLVINFDGQAAELTDQHFRFDLNGDGSQEELAMLGAGSGYLAIDKNANGRIDSGSELFGPATGQGFAELAKYDQDGNGWIDENDAVYSQLKVWTPDAQGAGKLATLKQANVGALSLGQVATPFELRGKQNSDLGAEKATGIYLSEDGKAGTVQEIDLTV